MAMQQPQSLAVIVLRLFAFAGLVLCDANAIAADAGADSACCGANHAQECTIAPVAIDIPSEPVSEALNDFARQSGLQIQIDSKDAIDKRSQAVTGTYLPWIALERLLADTGLKYDCQDARTISVRVAHSDSFSAIETTGLNPTTDLPAVGRARVAAPSLHRRGFKPARRSKQSRA